MNTRDPVSSTTSNVVLWSAAIAAMAAGLFTLGTINALHSLNEGTAVQLTPSDFTWWAGLNIGFSTTDSIHALPYGNPQVGKLISLDQKLVASIGTPSKRRLFTPQRVRKTHSHTDQIRVSAARAIESKSLPNTNPEEALRDSEPTSREKFSQAQAEAHKMRLLYANLRGTFRLAMSSQPEVSSQKVMTIIQQPPDQTHQTVAAHVIERQRPPQKSALKKLQITQHLQVASPVTEQRRSTPEPLPSARSAPGEQINNPNSRFELPVHTQPAGRVAPALVSKIDTLDTIRLTQSQASPAVTLDAPARSELKEQQEAPPTAPVTTRPSTRVMNTISATTSEHPRTPRKVTSLDMMNRKISLFEGSSVTTQKLENTQRAQRKGNEYSSFDSVIARKNANNLAHVNTQLQGTNQRIQPDQVHLSQAMPSHSVLEPICNPESQGIGAFTEDKNWFSIFKKVFSEEGPAGGNQAKWILTASQARKSHWSTLALEKKGDEKCTPLLAQNDVTALSLLAKARIQEETGIVFGRVPAGWELDLQTRSEEAIYFDQHFKPVTLAADKARYFAFVNVAPGFPLLYLNSASAGNTAAISLPVKPGIATYLDLTPPEKKSISGGIFRASSKKQTGVKSLSVNVIGQDSKTAITQASGFFKLTDVLMVGDHPVYLDVTMNDKAFKHRYKIMPNQTEELSLFHISEAQIEFWMSQLEGGVSPASGLILSADRRIRENETKRPFPQVSSMLERATLTPETYTLSPEDHLLVKTPMKTGQARFISVQVPEGANLASVITQDGRVIWSQLVVSQPGVVNVIDSY